MGSGEFCSSYFTYPAGPSFDCCTPPGVSFSFQPDVYYPTEWTGSTTYIGGVPDPDITDTPLPMEWDATLGSYGGWSCEVNTPDGRTLDAYLYPLSGGFGSVLWNVSFGVNGNDPGEREGYGGAGTNWTSTSFPVDAPLGFIDITFSAVFHP